MPDAARSDHSAGTAGRWRALPPLACIVGAPRCGTTTLARLLAGRPDVCFSSPKEPHFFAINDLADQPDGALRDAVERGYLDRFFHHCDGSEQLLAEGSVSYLYAPERMAAILRLWPDARFVIALRDPFQMLPSLHQRHVYQGDETERDFERAWRLVPERASGRSIPRTCLDPRLLRYDEAGRLGHHVERFFRAVGKERCLVTLHEDLVADPQAVYRRLEDFLGLSSLPMPEVRAHRAAMGFKIGWLQRLLKRPPVITRTVLAGELYRQRVAPRPDRTPSRPAALVMRWRKALLRWNEAPPPRTALSPELASELRAHLERDVALLEGLIGRDLSHWLGRQPAR